MNAWVGLGAIVLLGLGAACTPRAAAQPVEGSGVGASATPAGGPSSPLDDGWVDALLARYPERFGEMVAGAEAHRMQVLIGEVVCDGEQCGLVQHGFRTDAEYYYSASAIKLAAAVAALQVLAGMQSQPNAPTLDTPVSFGSTETTLRQTIMEALIVSSNEAYNHLFDFAGHEALNQMMWDAGLNSVRVQRRFFSARTASDNRWAPEVVFELEGGGEYAVPERKSMILMPPVAIGGQLVGDAYMQDDVRVPEPMSFAEHNQISLVDLQRLLVGVVRPELLDVRGFVLGDADREWLAGVLAMGPEVLGPSEDGETRFKPMVRGIVESVERERVVYYNKAGRAYGFHTENAYVVDRETGRSFFVTAALYMNEDGVLNDGDYEYGDSYEFLGNLGEVLANELFLSD